MCVLPSSSFLRHIKCLHGVIPYFSSCVSLSDFLIHDTLLRISSLSHRVRPTANFALTAPCHARFWVIAIMCRITLRCKVHHDLATHFRGCHVPAHQRFEYTPNNLEPRRCFRICESWAVNKSWVYVCEPYFPGVLLGQFFKQKCLHE